MWNSAAPSPQLAEDELRVYRLTLVFDADALADAELLLSDGERTRMAGYQSPVRRMRFAVGRAAVRRILSEHLGVAPIGVPLVAPRHHKPHLHHMNGWIDLRFNVAHSGSTLLCAVARGAEVGVDVELDRPGQDVAAVIDTAFSQSERNKIDGLPPKDRYRAALLQWTRKEALLKATGAGLRTPPATLELGVAPGRPARGVALVTAGRRWRLWDLDMGDKGTAAVVAEGAGRPLVLLDR